MLVRAHGTQKRTQSPAHAGMIRITSQSRSHTLLELHGVRRVHEQIRELRAVEPFHELCVDLQSLLVPKRVVLEHFSCRYTAAQRAMHRLRGANAAAHPQKNARRKHWIEKGGCVPGE